MPALAEPQTLSELIERLGVPPERIRCRPAPGTATEADVLRLDDQRVFCELIDGVLVEKVMGLMHSRFAALLMHFIYTYLEECGEIGVIHGPDAPHRFFRDQVRYPDVSFVRYDRLPERRLPEELVASWTPNLAVEIISPGNTVREMDEKLKLYFDNGVELVWYADPELHEVRVYRSVSAVQFLGLNDELDGGTVLPGFRLSIGRWFTKARAGGAP